MNKHSKYRPLLDKVELKIARHELSVHGAYQIMLESLDEAETAELALREDLEALRAAISVPWPINDAISKLCEAAAILLDDKSYDGQGHEEIRAALNAAKDYTSKAPAQSLAKVRADAIRDMLKCVLRVSDGFSHDLIGRIKEYTNHIEAGL